MKTRKVMDIHMRGNHFVCIQDLEREADAYCLYQTWYNRGTHKKLLGRLSNPKMVLWEIMKRS